MIEVLNILAILFIASSILHGFISWLGRSFENAGSTSEKYKAMLFGFHTASSLRKYMKAEYLNSALFFMRLRNVSFVLLVVLTLVEYFSR